MIELLDVAYARVGAASLETAENFATRILGLQVFERSKGGLYLRSDDRAHTLCYFEGDPGDQTVGLEVAGMAQLESAATTLDALGHAVTLGDAGGCAARKVAGYIGFKDPTGNSIELVVKPERSGRRYFASRDAGITGFSHVGLYSTNPKRDESFWTQVCNARVSDRIGDIALMRINAIHHTLALAPGAGPGIHHVNHQVADTADVFRSYYFLKANGVPLFLGPGRHPTSGARFVYFKSPDGMTFEYSVGVNAIEDEASHRPRQFPMLPSSICMWGSKPVLG